MGLLGVHCFYIKKMDALCKRWEYNNCKQIFTRDKNLIKHVEERGCRGGKTKIMCSGGKFRHILNSSENVFYYGDTKFSYTACKWIGKEAVKLGRHIHHKMLGHGGELRVKAWVLDPKGEKAPAYFSVDCFEPKTNTVYYFYGCHWHGHTRMKNRTKRPKMR